MRIHTKKFLSVLLTVMMLFTVAVPAFAAVKTGPKALELIPYDASQLNVKKLGAFSAVTKEAEKHDPDEIVRVSIVLDKKSTIEAGFPMKTIGTNKQAVSYRNALKAQQAKVADAIEKKLGVELDVKRNLTLAMNAISANVRWGDLKTLLLADGVASVELENRYDPLTVGNTADPDMAVSVGVTGAEAAWVDGYYGQGSQIAIVDTGLMDTHQSVDPDAFDYAIAEDEAASGLTYDLLTADKIAAVFDQLNAADDPAISSAADLYLNSKIPFHYNYVDGGTRTDHVGPGDSDQAGEHGSHVSGISAANRYVKQNGEFVDAKEAVMAVGNAPDAQLLVMKVFGIGGGAYDSDYMAAIEDSIILGAESVNLSLGSGNPGSVFANEYQYVMDMLEESDTVYCGSAGNSYSWDYALTNDYGIYADGVSLATSGSPSSYFNSLSVAASENPQMIGKPLRFCEDVNAIYTETSNAGGAISRLEGNTYDFVYIDGVGEAEEYAAVAAEISLEGKAVITNRGAISFYVKGNNLIDYAPALLIVANNQPGTINMALDDYTGTFPMVSITRADADAIMAASDKQTVGGYDVYTGTMSVLADPVAMDTGYNTDPTDFSSWGATGALTLKPEITAPGGNIRSIHGYATEDGTTYTGGEDAYELMSGTSMASPQMAGLVAVLAQYIRENDLVGKTGLTQRQLIHSLLMSTSIPMLDANGDYYPVLQQGSGLANVASAVAAESFIKMDDNATVSAADGKVKAELGQNASRDGKYEFSFVLTNLSDEDRTYAVSTDLFTQALEEGYYDYVISHSIEALDADVTYAWEILGDGHDVDLDGDTDEDDVQAILDVVTGIFDADYDEAAADLDEDGAITSRDAYTLLTLLGSEGEATVPAGGAARVTVSIELTEDQRATLDESRLSAWVEGFTTVSCEDDVTHSIPIIGIYGSFTDSSMFDAVTAFDAYNDNLWRASYSGNYETNGFVFKNGTSSYFFTGNPYLAEPDADPARFAVSPKAKLVSVKHTLIRNAGTTIAVIFDEDGEVIWSGSPENDVDGMYYYVNGGEWRNNGVTTTAINQTLKDLGLGVDDRFTVKFFAVPEYYALTLDPTTTSGAISLDDILALYDAGEIGEGACLSMEAGFDSTAPKILSATLDGNTVTVTAQDDKYVAAIALMDINGNVMYTGEIPEQSAPGEEVTVELDITGLDMGVAAAVFVGDYAANEDAALIRFADGPILATRTHYYLTDTLEAGAPYVITASADVGTASALLSNGQNYYTSSQDVKLVADEFGVYVDDGSLDDTITWNTSDGVVFTNAADGGVLGYNSPNNPFVCWANAGYADYFEYDGTDLDNGYASYGYNMYFESGYFYWGYQGENTPEYLFTPQSFEYEIDPEAASEVVVEPKAVTLILDVLETVELSATVKPIVLPDKTVTWSSSDESVATVDQNGVVTAVSEGSAVITAASNQTPDVVGTCTVNVVAEAPIDYTVYAQVSYGKDDMRFEAIDLNDMSTEKIADAYSTFISGGLSGHYIWGTDTDIDVVRYDIDNGFAPEDMFSLNPTYLPYDSASFPSFTIVDGDNEYVHDYYYASVLKNGWFTMWTGENGSDASYFDLGGDGLYLVALAFCGAYYDEEANKQELYYYGLDTEGNLYLLYIYNDGEDLSIGAAPLGNIGILTMGDDMTAFSMAYSGYGMNNESILIADNNMKSIYYVEIDPQTGAFTPSYVGKLDTASSLAGLFNIDFDTVAELSADQIAGYKAVLAGAKTVSMQKADLSLDAAVETAEIETLHSARVSVVKTADKNGEVVNPEQKYAYELTLTEDVDTNNGLIKVTYDPSVATYVNYKSALDFHSISVDEENGVILFGYASYNAIPAGETLAAIFFASDEEEAPVYVHDEELNDELGITDHEFGEPEWAWEGSDEDGYDAATATFTATDEFGVSEEVEAEITVETIPATCTEDGLAIYTATVVFKGVTYTSVKEVVIPATGHDFSEGNQCANCGEWEECPWCGEQHHEGTIAGWWTALIHHILYIINRIFLWWSPIAR